MYFHKRLLYIILIIVDEYDDCLKVSSQDLVLGSNQRKGVDLTLVSYSQGTLEIYGIAWILQGSIRCVKHFQGPSPSLKKNNKLTTNFKFRNSTIFNESNQVVIRESKALQSFSKFSLPVLKGAPLLRLSPKADFKARMLCGEYQQFELVIFNDSDHLIDDLELKVSHPMFFSAFYQKSNFSYSPFQINLIFR
jgi:hypothetical protein